MQQTIFEHFSHCTVLCISHKLDILMDFDMVIVLDQGRIIEQDSPRSLLRKASVFAEMYGMKAGQQGLLES